MAAASASVAVDRPIDDVFRFLAHGMNNPLWMPEISVVARLKGSGGPPELGTSYYQKVRLDSGRTAEETYELTTWEPPRLLEFLTSRGTTRLAGRYRLAAINTTTTHVEFTLDRVSREYRLERRPAASGELQDRVNRITNLPAAMRDNGATPL